ncbi:MAG TPA: hypothetical protein VFQ53_37075 [Kofleriaceae bacterium]|nr:hypothetical protein [Kofleriaceae bacterium]
MTTLFLASIICGVVALLWRGRGARVARIAGVLLVLLAIVLHLRSPRPRVETAADRRPLRDVCTWLYSTLEGLAVSEHLEFTGRPDAYADWLKMPSETRRWIMSAIEKSAAHCVTTPLTCVQRLRAAEGDVARFYEAVWTVDPAWRSGASCFDLTPWVP